MLTFGTVWAVVTMSAQTIPGNPLNGLEKLKDFQAMRASSSDANWKDGNNDARPIAPGGTLTIAELKGPGMITHIWCTIAHDAPYYSRLLTLRIYWDTETQPSVECPIGDFFGVGHGVDKSFVSIPLRVSSDGRGRNCYWPMPFRKSARLTVTNESDKKCNAFYYYVDWQQHPQLAADAAYFHAMYRQEYPCTMGKNYLLADIQGCGHYVGTIQSVYLMSGGWYGEGDDFFFIDGEAEPRLRGTGTEDYFRDGWGFRQQDGPFYGTPLWEGYEAGNRSTAYRFHIPDPIPFRKSLRVEIEHKGSQTFPDGAVDGFIERDDLMSSVALWYQTEPHKPWAALPPGQSRLPFQEFNALVGWQAVPSARHSEHPIQPQELAGITTDNKQLFFTPGDAKGWVELSFKTEREQSAELWGKFVHAPDYGTYRVSLDGVELGVADLYAMSIAPSSVRWGLRNLPAGEHSLRFDCVGKNPSSKGFYLGFDSLAVRVPVYARPPGFDLRKVKAAR